MDQNCGGTIDVGGSGGILVSQRDHEYRNYMDCKLIITADSSRRILLTFDWVDIKDRPKCKQDYLGVYEGKSNYFLSRNLGLICGTSARSIVSRTNAVTLRFKTNKSGTGRGFVLSYTSFESPTSEGCGADEFKCDNYRCIDASLKFNDYDNCGDNSDETLFINGTIDTENTASNKAGILAVIHLGAIGAGVLVCVLVGRLCWRYFSNKRQLQQASSQVVSNTPQEQPPIAMQPTGQSSQPASYGQPGAYPAGQQAYPAIQPAYPAGQPAYPAGQPAYPAGQPAYPAGQPTYPAGYPTAYPGEQV
ncbi:enteropeptidase-like isoform X2 [Acanthaster planci]|nr:enteropeptidase-like isoform X2 [Acanthaster planci]